MRRLHLLELEDQPWLPRAIRDGVTDFLEFAVVRSGLYRGIEDRLKQALLESGRTQVLDLCSGGGGAWAHLLDALPPEIEHVRLSDAYPNLAAFRERSAESGGRIGFVDSAVDARSVPPTSHSFRTLFSSFHHFPPDDARAILADAVDSGSPIAIFESTQRHPLLMFYMLLTPILVLLATPLIKTRFCF